MAGILKSGTIDLHSNGWSLLIDGLLLLEEHKKGALVRRKPIDNLEAVVEDDRDFWAANIFLHDEIYLRSGIITSTPGQKWERLKRFVRAGITRWGTHALSVRRLVELQGALLDLINHRSEDLESAGGDDEDSRASTAEVIALIDSGWLGPFWTGVHRCVLNLFLLTGALICPAGYHVILRPFPSRQMSLKELILALTMSLSHSRFFITGIQLIPNPSTAPPTIQSSALALPSAGRH